LIAGGVVYFQDLESSWRSTPEPSAGQALGEAEDRREQLAGLRNPVECVVGCRQ
jgi:hypothetical protein